MNFYKYTLMENSSFTYAEFLNSFLKSEDFKEYNSYCCKLASGGGLYARATVEKRQAVIDKALDNFASGIKKSA